MRENKADPIKEARANLIVFNSFRDAMKDNFNNNFNDHLNVNLKIAADKILEIECNLYNQGDRFSQDVLGYDKLGMEMTHALTQYISAGNDPDKLNKALGCIEKSATDSLKVLSQAWTNVADSRRSDSDMSAVSTYYPEISSDGDVDQSSVLADVENQLRTSNVEHSILQRYVDVQGEKQKLLTLEEKHANQSRRRQSKADSRRESPSSSVLGEVERDLLRENHNTNPHLKKFNETNITKNPVLRTYHAISGVPAIPPSKPIPSPAQKSSEILDRTEKGSFESESKSTISPKSR